MGTHCIEHWTRLRYPNEPLVIFNSRADGPETSHQGARDVHIRKDSQQAILLRVYAMREHWDAGLTDEEAGDISGLSDKKRCAYWRRCGELREMGLLEDTGLRRVGSAGSPQRAFRISMRGMGAVQELR